QEILRMKFATSAAHVTGKPLASSESATWLNEHTLATLAEVKQAVDKFFLGGVNHIFYHGTPFSPESEPWPGWMFYAAVHFGPTNSFWNDFAALYRYVARCQSFLQAGKPDNDVLLYYPIYYGWSQTPTTSRSMLPHYGGGIESALGQADGQTLLEAGYSYDLISDRQLRSVTFADGSLQTGGASYKYIILPEMRFIQPETFERLIALAHEGARIIVLNSLPSDVPGWGDLERRRNSLKALIAGLRFNKSAYGNVQVANTGKGSFFSPSSNGFGFRSGGTPDISRWWKHQEIRQPLIPAPEGRQTKLICRPFGAGRIVTPAFPVVPPPANVRCASGAKTVRHFLKNPDFVRVGRIFSALAIILSLFVFAPPIIAQKAAAHRTNYLFAYFKNNGEDGLHLAYSHDGLKWNALNEDKPYLTPVGGSQRLMRDPCVIQGPDGVFHMVWTTGWRGQDIGVAHSKDLIRWSDQKPIPVMAHEPTAINCWAPEIFYDEERK